MDTVRIGVVGIGGMGSHHARYLLNGEIPNAELTAVCDISPERLKWAKENLGEGIQRFDGADALFRAKVVDAVIIATPHYDHPPIAIDAFEHGLHVLTEKPSGVHTKQAREMNEAAARSGKVFSIMFQSRTGPVCRKLKELVASGELGELRRVIWLCTDSYRSQSYYDSGGWRATWGGEGGGVLINQCPHDLDIWQWVCGVPRRVRAFMAFGKYHDIEVEDDVSAYVEYPNGATGLFATTTGESPGTSRFELNGERGKIVVERGTLSFWRTRVPVSQFTREYEGGFGSPETWKIDVPIRGSSEGHRGITRNWIQAILTGAPLIVPGEEGINSLEISNAMHLSAWTDSWVDIPVDEGLFYEKLQQRIRSSRSRKPSGEGKTLDVEKSW